MCCPQHKNNSFVVQKHRAGGAYVLGNVNCRDSSRQRGARLLELEAGLVSEARTKTHNIHAQERNIGGKKRQTLKKKKTYVGIAWVNVKSLHN